MSTLIDALKGLLNSDYANRSGDAYWKAQLSEIIAEHERSGGDDLLGLLKRTTKWIEGYAYGAPCPENGVLLVNEANALIAKHESSPKGQLTDCDMWDDESV